MYLGADVQAGQILAGKYRIERVLGQGGMGVVVAAHHIQLDEHVAIKFLLPDALASAEAVARFAREARAAVKIKSEHVARVTDVGTLETGSPYMVMEFLNGRDLGEVVHQQGSLPIDVAVDYVLQACEAIAEAHALGIIHRDLKPSNLFLTHRADGGASVKVLDFGISKVTGIGASGHDLGMTKTTAVLGSPLYMSPEQMSASRNVDSRTDIWALGAILHELLTGQVPFNAETMPQLCAMILQEPPPSLRDTRRDAPEGLAAVLLRCLEKDPARRFSSVAELAQGLAPYASRTGQISVERVKRVLSAAGITSPHLEGATRPHDPRGHTQSAWGRTSPGGRRRGPWIALGVGVVALAGAALGLGWFLLRPGPAPVPSASALTAPSAEIAEPPAKTPPPAEVDVRPAETAAPSAAPPASAEPEAAPSADASSASSSPPPRGTPPSTRPTSRTPPPPSPRPAVSATPTPKPAFDLYGDRK